MEGKLASGSWGLQWNLMKISGTHLYGLLMTYSMMVGFQEETLQKHIFQS
jgi:hypothetical protein